MEIGNIKKNEFPVKNEVMSQCLVFVEKFARAMRLVSA